MKLLVRILNMLVFPVTLVTGLLLGASMLAPHLHPSLSSWIQLLGLAFPILFLLNLLWLIYWWIQLRLKLIFPLGMAILCFFQLGKYAQYKSDDVQPADTAAIKVCSVNAQLFGAYQNRWFFDTVADVLIAKNADIVCLQEVYARRNIDKMAAQLKEKTGYKYMQLFRLVPERNYGMLILSKYPILGNGRVDFPGTTGNMAAYADLQVKEQVIRVYNVHLQSIRFRKTDYDFVNGADMEEGTNLQQGKGLLRRMRDAYGKRAEQADAVAGHIKLSNVKNVLVCGDFNDVPLSYAYHTVAADLKDAFREAGSGLERTYLGPFPSFRIDYILSSPEITFKNYQSSAEIPGDHKLLWADFTMPKNPDKE
jgi:endonuclease/exonuclease/phosphatase family metal-dependent hydrolase